MTTCKIAGGPAGIAFAEASLLELAAAPQVRDERDLPPPLDVLGARFRATQTGYGLELRLPKDRAKRDRMLARAEMIWLGTR